MSIKTSNGKILFFFFSLFLHAGAIGILLMAGEVRIFLKPSPYKRNPVFVDVIDLLPGNGTGFAQGGGQGGVPTRRVGRGGGGGPEKRPGPALRATVRKPFASGKGTGQRELSMSRAPQKNLQLAEPLKDKQNTPSTQKEGEAPSAGVTIGTPPSKRGSQATRAITQESGGGGEGGEGGGDEGGGGGRGGGEGGGGGWGGGRGGGSGGGGGGGGGKWGLKLFPTEQRLTELAQDYEKDSPKEEKGKTLALNTAELKYQKYLLSMKQRIEAYWDYPSSSVRNGEQGRLTIDFTITKDGGVDNIKLVKSSNYPALDDAAITALKLATPFSPFPPGFDIGSVNIHASFEYQILYSRRR